MKKRGDPQFELKKKVLEKYLKPDIAAYLFTPKGRKDLAAQLGALKKLAATYSLEFLLDDFSLEYKCNFITHLFTREVQKEMAAAKQRLGLKFDPAPVILLSDEKLGEDSNVKPKGGIKEFLKG